MKAIHTRPVTALPTVSELCDLVASGGSIDTLFFYGHRPEADGSIGPGCLSQWWPARFELDGRAFATAEHFMMWGKATLFGDDGAAAKILRAADPRAAKRLGRQVRGFDLAVWEQQRFDIVVRGSAAKFGQNRELGRFLAATGDRVLVEASPSDRIWGIGLSAGDERAADPRTWRGSNLLGFALMQARALLRAG